jgi:hypothetical protein
VSNEKVHLVQRHGFNLRFCIFIFADGDIGDLFFQRLKAGHGLGGVFYQMVWAVA